MSDEGRLLTIVFPDRERFRREYRENISNGGVFVATDVFHEEGERVRVRLDLDFCAESMSLAAEVVRFVGPDMSDVGGVPGVALRLEPDLMTIRRTLGPIADQLVDEDEIGGAEDDRRAAPRSDVRVRALIRHGNGEQCEGWTRDLSTGGVLVSTLTEAPAIGSDVEIRLRLRAVRDDDPDDLAGARPEITIPGIIRRHIEGEHGQVLAVGVQFLPAPDQEAASFEFLQTLKSAEHVRRLAEVSGSLEVLPVPDLVQSLARSAGEGTLTLTRGGELGVIVFRDGLICGASLGAVVGRKAIVRLLMWDDGRFEFESTLPETLPAGEEDPIEWVLMEGLRLVDEMRRPGRPHFDPRARLRLPEKQRREAVDDLDKLDSAIIDLASARMSVHRVVDTIPEPDPEIYDRLAELIALGLIELDR